MEGQVIVKTEDKSTILNLLKNDVKRRGFNISKIQRTLSMSNPRVLKTVAYLEGKGMVETYKEGKSTVVRIVSVTPHEGSNTPKEMVGDAPGGGS